MNTFLDARYDKLVHRLAIGLEPVDAVTLTRVAVPLEVTIDRDDAIAPRRGRPVERHRSSRFALRHGVTPPVTLRLEDPTRRFVPRRIRFGFPTQAEVLADEAAGTPMAAPRIRRPVLFPGASYPLLGRATGLRGRVTRGRAPVRWARIVADVAASGVRIGRAHGDDRGEFLLLLGTDPSSLAELESPLHVNIAAVGPDPQPPAPDENAEDQLSDLPVEIAAAPNDDVASGIQLPAGYEPGRRVARRVSVPLGRITSLRTPFDLP
jgi:hypothetical protein